MVEPPLEPTPKYRRKRSRIATSAASLRNTIPRSRTVHYLNLPTEIRPVQLQTLLRCCCVCGGDGAQPYLTPGVTKPSKAESQGQKKLVDAPTVPVVSAPVPGVAGANGTTWLR